MPPRPKGTDGSDHSYREVIVERYKRMADYSDAIHKLMMLHLVFVLGKLGWALVVFHCGGVPPPNPVLGLVAGELLLHGVLRAAKLGQSRESLSKLKAFNMIQALLTATVVLSAWTYHQGTNTNGVPMYEHAHVVANALAGYATTLPVSVLDVLKAFELFLDMSTAAFFAMATFVTHKMVVEKMQMKAEKSAALGRQRGGAVRGGGSDSDSDSDDDDEPQAVPLAAQQQQEKPKVAKVAAASSMRRRHA